MKNIFYVIDFSIYWTYNMIEIDKILSGFLSIGLLEIQKFRNYRKRSFD